MAAGLQQEFLLAGSAAVVERVRIPRTRRSNPAVLGSILILAACIPGLRAQVTESPQTIEPGGVLMRMDAISLGIRPDTAAPNQYKELALGTTLVSVRITDSVDLEFVTQLFLRDTFSTAGTDQTQSGIGDVTLRPKWTFWSDPSSGQEAAVIPYVMLPTNSSAVGNNSVEGGVIVPWIRNVAAGLKAEGMVEWDELRNLSNTRYDTRWYGSPAVQWDFGGRLGAYAETTMSLSTAGSSSSSGTLGGGATLSISRNFQWDFEVSRVLGSGRSAWEEVLRFRWRIF
jgi:hypothetical protein